MYWVDRRETRLLEQPAFHSKNPHSIALLLLFSCASSWFPLCPSSPPLSSVFNRDIQPHLLLAFLAQQNKNQVDELRHELRYLQ